MSAFYAADVIRTMTPAVESNWTRDHYLCPVYLAIMPDGTQEVAILAPALNDPLARDVMNPVLRSRYHGRAVSGCLIIEGCVSVEKRRPGQSEREAFEEHIARVGSPSQDPDRTEAAVIVAEVRLPDGRIDRAQAVIPLTRDPYALGQATIEPVYLGGPLDGAVRNLGLGIL